MERLGPIVLVKLLSFLTELHKVSEEISTTAEVNLKPSDLARTDDQALSDMRSVNSVIGLDSFKKIVEIQKIPSAQNYDLARALLSEIFIRRSFLWKY